MSIKTYVQTRVVCLLPLLVIQFGIYYIYIISEVNSPNQRRKVIGPKRKVFCVDCIKIFEGDKNEIIKAKQYMVNHKKIRKNDSWFIDIAKDCKTFLKTYDYQNYRMHAEEVVFPIAYSILMYKDVEQMEKLLRAIYRPHNAYCIHIDKSAQPSVHLGVRAISNCFHNVFVPTKLEDVVYNGISRLKADLNCMSDLLHLSVKWKYFLNLPSQQYPLKTNYEIVKILKIYNGANDIEGISNPNRLLPQRFQFSHKVDYKRMIVYRTKKLKSHPPHNLTIVKGSAYGIFSRDFVNYIIHNQNARDLLEWMEDVQSPDEMYWATLHHSQILNVPGGYRGVPEGKPWLAVYVAWAKSRPCHGQFVRDTCVFGIEDLETLISRNELFANKFYIDYQYLTLDCLEEWLFNKTYNELPLATDYFKRLRFIKPSAIIK